MSLYLNDNNHGENLVMATGHTGILDVLAWWCQNIHSFPILSCIACDFLAVLVSRVGVENLFSVVCDICYY